MLSKVQIKQIKSLSVKKNRKEQQLFVAEGVKVVNELLQSAFKIKNIYATSAWIKGNEALSNSIQKKIIEISLNELQRISSLITPNEVLAIVEVPYNNLTKEIFLQENINLMLDDVTDPGNLGTIIRIADWFGINNIVCSQNCVDAYNSKVVQAAMGSLFRVKIMYLNLYEFIKKNKKFSVVGAVLNGKSIYKTQLPEKAIILLGNESKGISKELTGMIDCPITIPSNGNADSLNVAVSAGIICYEFAKQLSGKSNQKTVIM